MIAKKRILQWSLPFVALVVAIFFFVGRKESYPNEKPFVVVIPSYQNQKWYRYNLDSVYGQKYHNYRVIYTDDRSPDGTGELVQKYLKEKNVEDKTTFIRNAERVGALHNIYTMIWKCQPDEIVVCLDGDDRLYHDHVLEHLNSVYSDPNVWVTYGQFIYHEGSPGWAAQVPQAIIAANAIRDYPWVTNHLRTFYAGLFHKIDKEDLLYKGAFYPMAGDLAFMFPIVEMAGKHSRFIPEVLYEYNVQTGINDIVLDRTRQENLGFHIRTLKRYQPLKKR